ncbi:MAG: pyridoxine 5'-phosphate synthase [Deltaproteobacteria bacterium]|jgi:pyridoxine 5-phosphate synthase|nr:pyridoxine 5'-phosphate synthase [Deltaproteobacteria bacterium]
MAGLAVRIDRVAALRESRKSAFPDPVAAAVIAELAGADGITMHLREDRQYIQDRDVRILRQTIQSKLILEMASSTEMVGMALDIKPDHVTLVPEKRVEFSAGGGLDLVIHNEEIREVVDTLQNSGIPVGILIDPDSEQLKQAHRTNAKIVELHTGAYCDAKTSKTRHQEFIKLVDAVKLAHKLNLDIKAGHGLCYKTIKAFRGLAEIDEFSIGHSLISRAVLTGMDTAVKEMIALIRAL